MSPSTADAWTPLNFGIRHWAVCAWPSVNAISRITMERSAAFKRSLVMCKLHLNKTKKRLGPSISKWMHWCYSCLILFHRLVTRTSGTVPSCSNIAIETCDILWKCQPRLDRLKTCADSWTGSKHVARKGQRSSFAKAWTIKVQSPKWLPTSINFNGLFGPPGRCSVANLENKTWASANNRFPFWWVQKGRCSSWM